MLNNLSLQYFHLFNCWIVAGKTVLWLLHQTLWSDSYELCEKLLVKLTLGLLDFSDKTMNIALCLVYGSILIVTVVLLTIVIKYLKEKVLEVHFLRYQILIDLSFLVQQIHQSHSMIKHIAQSVPGTIKYLGIPLVQIRLLKIKIINFNYQTVLISVSQPFFQSRHLS